ncbi:MAG: signal peptide peptidase SppA [Opitutaceae bacterium]|jgi:protease-4
MRNFFTSLLGAFTALVIFFTGLCFFGLMFIIVIAASGQKKKQGKLENGSYIVYNLESNIVDAPQSVDFGQLARGGNEAMQLRVAANALRSAAKDSRIAGILLTGSFEPSGYGTSYAALKELRAALKEIRAAGKPVKAYLNDASAKDYYLASVASDIALDPYGLIIMPGLASRPWFFAGFFEKFGFGVQVTRVGKYKSAVEPFTRKDLSPENREQISVLLGDIWKDLLADIAASRNLKPEDLQRVVDSEGLIRAEIAKNAKLVDRVVYRDQVIDELKAKTGRTGSKDSFKQISLEEYLKFAKAPGSDAPKTTAKAPAKKPATILGRVAIVYAEGEIVDGEGDRGMVGGTRFARELRKLREDNDIKAIVLRVNSPGGSASASEHIQREIRLAREKKPVIVSMGGLAASGGYWISAYGNRIFAEPTTITGSIGVFGLFLDFEKLANSIGVTFDTVKTGQFADALTATRPKTEAELAVMQRMVDWIYDEFVGKVADARKLKREAVHEIAQGRVWSGTSALKLGLVDEIGGLDAAIRYAGIQAGLGEYPKLTEYPRKKELAELLTEMFEKVQPSMRQSGIVGSIASRVEKELSALNAFNDPHGVYARLPIGLQVE